jgi:hypothetical protein
MRRDTTQMRSFCVWVFAALAKKDSFLEATEKEKIISSEYQSCEVKPGTRADPQAAQDQSLGRCQQL